MNKWMNQGTTYCYNDSIADIENCSRYGFEAIEFKYNRIKNTDLEMLKKHLQRHKVSAGCLGAFELPVLVSKEVKKQFDCKFMEMCQIAERIGSKKILVNLCGKEYQLPLGIIKDYACENLARYSNVAKQYGVEIAIEVTGYNGIITFRIKDAIEMISRLNLDNLKIVFDVYHFFGMKEDKKELNCLSKDMISTVHLCDGINDMSGVYSDEGRLWPGEGNFELDEIAKWLKVIQYDGPLSVEVFSTNGWTYDIEKCYQIAEKKYHDFMSGREIA